MLETRMARKWLVVLMLVACGTLALTACGDNSSGTSAAGKGANSFYTGGTPTGTPAKGGTLIFDRSLEVSTFDPLQAADNGTIWGLLNVYDQLTVNLPDKTGPQPSLATKWTTSQDRLSWRFTLRQGVRFSDGTPLTGRDVRFSLQRLMTPANANFPFVSENFKKVSLPRPDIVQIDLTKPTPGLPALLTEVGASILPAKLYEQQGAEEFAKHGMGSGPFMVKEYKPGDRLELVRNPHYWQAGRPYLDRVVFRLVNDANTRILDVKSGQAQVAEEVPFSQIDALLATRDVKMLVQPFSAIVFIPVNQAEGSKFADREVRIALNYATPRQSIIDAVYRGKAEIANSTIPRTDTWNPDTKQYPYDVAKAKAHMTRSSSPNGFAATMQIVGADPDSKQIAQILQQAYAKIGIRLKIQQYDFATLGTNWFARKYEILLFPGNAITADTTVDDPLATIYQQWTPTYHAGQTDYDDPAVNRAVKLAKTTEGAERAKHFAFSQQRTTIDNPLGIPIAFVPSRTLVAASVRNFSTTPTGAWNLQQVYIER